MSLTYDIEADWELLTTCNFRCPYCFVPLSALAAKLTTHGTNAQWVEGFAATRKRWLLHISGGEPSIYPGFVDLCEKLTQLHYLSINSNLTHRSIETFAERINPERVQFINASLHYYERSNGHSLDDFINRIHKLRMRRFCVFISSVMTPLLLREFPQISKDFEYHGLFLIPKVMRGWFQGKIYPGAYSEDEKFLIREYLAKAQQDYVSITAEMKEPPTINMLTDDRLLDGPRIYRGKLCGSGFNFVRIEPNGAVIRCGSGVELGNILLKTVAFLDYPKPCDTVYCPYFCEKYTSPRFVPQDQNKQDVGDFFWSLKKWRDSQRQKAGN